MLRSNNIGINYLKLEIACECVPNGLGKVLQSLEEHAENKTTN